MEQTRQERLQMVLDLRDEVERRAHEVVVSLDVRFGGICASVAQVKGKEQSEYLQARIRSLLTSPDVESATEAELVDDLVMFRKLTVVMSKEVMVLKREQSYKLRQEFAEAVLRFAEQGYRVVSQDAFGEEDVLYEGVPGWGRRDEHSFESLRQWRYDTQKGKLLHDVLALSQTKCIVLKMVDETGEGWVPFYHMTR